MGKRIGRWGFVNYVDHPTNKSYRLFNFNSQREADLFEEMLTKQKIWFEKDVEDHEGEPLYLFAVNERDFSKAQNANFMVSAKTRSFLIPNRILRYTLLLFIFGIITLAIIGYLKAR